MTDGVEQWFLDLPLWVQTPLMLVVLVPLAAVVAVVMLRIASVVPRPDAAEPRAFGTEDGEEQ